MNLDTTYQAILTAARERRFITYGDLAKANGQVWKKVYRQMPGHLGELMVLCHEEGWPLLSALVMPQGAVETGKLEGSAQDGFVNAARSMGYEIEDPADFITEQQQRAFTWAPDAPDSLGIDAAHEEQDPEGGPRFVRYFAPVLDALRALGGEAKPADVRAWLIENVPWVGEEIDAVTRSGRRSFEGKVGWARFYLVKAGLLDDGRRGWWKLSPDGEASHPTHAEALELFRRVREEGGFNSPPVKVDAPADTRATDDLFDDPDRQFWFAGSIWNGTDDQTDRLLAEGIWQTNKEDDERTRQLVLEMRPGDRIAIKASFVQKFDLPFDNRGKPVSVMRIKAVGTVTENMGDGRTVKVDWRPLDPPRDWLFYTYRSTVTRANLQHLRAKRLVRFAFSGEEQDYDFFLKQSYWAKKYSSDTVYSDEELDDEEGASLELDAPDVPGYELADIMADGCFLPEPELDRLLNRLRSKKNLILQGAPGTGKTWLAKRLGRALIGLRQPDRELLRSVQFHPSLSYEDFVRGWRPAGNGRLQLSDGIFMDVVNAALARPDTPFVLVIEEINRGNPAQIFGELLTLLEDSKRSPDEAVELAYRSHEGERVHIPDNLHVIGTMNIADRSLALVDLALRRRFAFVTLEPQLGDLWRRWCIEEAGLTADVVDLIVGRMTALNMRIAQDRSLGPQFRIGHSYVTPPRGARIVDGESWFADVVETEIRPLLDEYWFDAPEKVSEAVAALGLH
ncbi:AAA family ATPase [Rhodobacteraceae bacterium 2376]|uniref:AAA family ATPase n=1 Tax=Rhabdonatronobacter sediminivivens TaxID=2743469 RepID=A0A7Z0L143_9RHOB|nr:AAA family ATPase [Rhabdonatronobacter sediminivivens]NYS26586.1 AAA family ATPase [Rhabdonatronobacter sediminivivens]